MPEPGGVLVPGNDTQTGLRFVAAPAAATPGPNRVHLHLTSSSPDDQQATVTAALDLGARHLDVGQRPEEGHVVLADPGGNEFCVIEPGEAFLAGGTKISWDLRPDPERYGGRQQRLEVASSDPAATVARLVSLGANELGTRDGRRILADSDGNEFWLLPLVTT